MLLFAIWAFAISLINTIGTYSTLKDISEMNSILSSNFYMSQMMFYNWDTFEMHRFQYEYTSHIVFNFKSDEIYYWQVMYFKNCFLYDKTVPSTLKVFAPGSNLVVSFYNYNNVFDVRRFHRLPNNFWTLQVLGDLPTPKRPMDFWWIDENGFFNDHYKNCNYNNFLSEPERIKIKDVLYKKKIELIFCNFSMFLPIITILCL